MSLLKVDAITGKSDTTEVNSPITFTANTATLNSGATIASGVTFPAGMIINTTHKYIIKDFYTQNPRAWLNVETHTNIITGLTIGNKLRVVWSGFKLIAGQGSYALAIFSVFPNGVSDTPPGNSSTLPLGKKQIMTDWQNSQSRPQQATLTVEIPVAASAYDCKIYLATEDTGYSATLNGPEGVDNNGADNGIRNSGGPVEAQFMSGASMTCFEIQG